MVFQTGVYIGIVLGSITLLGICVGILYTRHRKDVKEARIRELLIQGRIQQTIDLNLPPLYDDHELDPVCVYEHELPPGVVLPVQPILVHSTPDSDHIIALETEVESRLESNHSTALSTPITGDDSPIAVEQSPHSNNQEDQEEGRTGGEVNSETLTNQISGLSSPPTPAALESPMTSPSSIPLASHRLIDQTMLNLARLPSPPSYDVPNRVIDRSPLGNPARHHHHHHSYSTSDVHHFTISPNIAPHNGTQQEDYFGHVRMRAHTISHPEPAHLPEFNLPAAVTTTTQPRHHHHEEDLPVTPRYSFEFPSHVPHHIHIEEHQRARAQYAMWATTNTPLSSSSSLPVASPNVIHDDTGLIPPHIPQMHGRSYSQPYNNYHSTQIESSSSPFRSSLNSTHGESINVSPIRLREQGQTQGRLGVRARARASTIGESSRLLIQRMQALTKKPFSVSRSAATSGQSSLNADPMDDLLSSEATTSVPTLVTAVSVPEVSVSVPEVSVSMPDVSVSAAETLAREPETCILQQEEDEGSDGSPTATVEAGHEHEESGCIITPAIQVFQSETLDHSCRQTILVPSDSSSSSLTSEVLPIGSMSAIITVS